MRAFGSRVHAPARRAPHRAHPRVARAHPARTPRVPRVPSRPSSPSSPSSVEIRYDRPRSIDSIRFDRIASTRDDSRRVASRRVESNRAHRLVDRGLVAARTGAPANEEVVEKVAHIMMTTTVTVAVCGRARGDRFDRVESIGSGRFDRVDSIRSGRFDSVRSIRSGRSNRSGRSRPWGPRWVPESERDKGKTVLLRCTCICVWVMRL